MPSSFQPGILPRAGARAPLCPRPHDASVINARPLVVTHLVLSVGRRSVVRMDVLLWLGWGCSLVVVVFTVWIFMFGALAVRSPRWSMEFQEAVALEIERRGLTERKLSQVELLAVQRMLGSSVEEVDDEVDARFLTVIQALTGIQDESVFEELHEKRQQILVNALEKQFHIVRNISSIRIASRVWQLRRFVSELTTGASGLRWFLPSFFTQTRQIGEKYLATATLFGVWLGLLYWGFIRFGRSTQEGGGIEWITIVGVVITLSTIFGLVLAVGSQFRKIARNLHDPTKRWTVKNVLVTTLYIGVMSSFLVLVATGTWQDWSIAVSDHATEALSKLEVSPTIGALLMLAFLGYLVRNAVTWIRVRQLKTSERIGMVTGIAFIAYLGAMLLLFIFGAPPIIVTAVIQVFVIILILGGMTTATAGAVEWFRTYRSLLASHVQVPRRGFRWWALCAWGLTAVGISAVDSISSSFAFSTGNSLLQAAVSWMDLMAISVLFITFWPGVIITWLFVRRVRKLSEQPPLTPPRKENPRVTRVQSAADHG